ncbi:MAG: hypothetical protein NTX03_07015 [Bacteroidetes bacterium]|nr:hypothetical protein [Bacteroidota bacterium]
MKIILFFVANTTEPPPDMWRYNIVLIVILMVLSVWIMNRLTRKKKD